MINEIKKVIIDAHCDIPSELFVRRIDGERRVLDNRFAPMLKKGGVNLPVFGIYVESRYKPSRALEMALRQIEVLLDDLAESSEFMLIKNKNDLKKFMEQDKIGIVLDMEGAEPLESGIELLHLFYRLGVRMLGFTWNNRNALADGVDESDTGGGLTRYGRLVLHEAQKLGIILDVSHMAPAGVDDVLKLSRGPIIASHSGAKGIYNCPRNLSDEHLKKIARTGGVIGVPAYHGMIASTSPNVENVVDHIEYISKITGQEHVGFGADFIDYFADLAREGRIGSEWIKALNIETKGLSSATEIPNLKLSMQKRGFSEKMINGTLGDNFYRIFKDILPEN